jgi:hypothetical protein
MSSEININEEKIDKIQKDQMVNLLKRNHDILMEKYEIFKARNASLEKVAVEKDSIYNDLRIEFDKCSNSLFKIQKQAEDFKTSKDIFE